MKVRIGNDIRLNLTLRGPKSYDQTNIKQLRAYFVNTSMKKFTEPWIDPCAGCCGPNAYSLHSCGPDHYHHLPYDCFRAGFCGYRHDHHHPHCCPFGCKDPMHCWHCHYCSFDNIHPSMRPNYGHPFHCDDHACRAHCSHYDHDLCDFGWAPVPPHVNEDFKFLAPSRVMEGYNRAQVYFPAADQFACGEYKLVIVLVLYETGWGRCDLHTYTIDYGKVLTLVDDESGVDGDIVIDVDTDSLENGDIAAINVVENTYHMYQNKYMAIGASDNYEKKYNIEVTLGNGSTITYNPRNWPYTPLRFESTNNDLVQIDNDGIIMTKSSPKMKEVRMIVKSAVSELISDEFTVVIEPAEKCYIGYAPVRPLGAVRNDQSFENDSQEASDITNGAENVDLSLLTELEDIEGTHEVTNTHNGWYLWIVSNKPISLVHSGIGNVPISSPEVIGSKYYYACLNPVRVDSDASIKTYIKIVA